MPDALDNDDDNDGVPDDLDKGDDDSLFSGYTSSEEHHPHAAHGHGHEKEKYHGRGHGDSPDHDGNDDDDHDEDEYDLVEVLHAWFNGEIDPKKLEAALDDADGDDNDDDDDDKKDEEACDADDQECNTAKNQKAAWRVKLEGWIEELTRLKDSFKLPAGHHRKLPELKQEIDLPELISTIGSRLKRQFMNWREGKKVCRVVTGSKPRSHQSAPAKQQQQHQQQQQQNQQQKPQKVKSPNKPVSKPAAQPAPAAKATKSKTK